MTASDEPPVIDTLGAIERGSVLGLLSAADKVLATKQLAERQGQALAEVRALADSWRYKGEFGWGAWQEGHGPDFEGQVLDDVAVKLQAILDRCAVD